MSVCVVSASTDAGMRQTKLAAMTADLIVALGCFISLGVSFVRVSNKHSKCPSRRRCHVPLFYFWTVPMCRCDRDADAPPRDDGTMTALFFGIIAKKIRTSRASRPHPNPQTTRQKRPTIQTTNRNTGNDAPSLHVQVPRGEEGLRLPLQACTHRRFRRWQVLPPPALCRELPFLSVPSMSMAEKK